MQIQMPAKLVPVFTGPARYRGSYGGRGSAKTRTFAKMTAVMGYKFAEAGIGGQILGLRQFMNSLDESSMAEIKEAIRSEPFLNDYYDIGEKYIRTKNQLVKYNFMGLTRNIDSIKSQGRVLLAWADEAEKVTENAWEKLTPTVREDNSEIWVTWNPENKRSATNLRFRQHATPDMKIVEMNYKDNPFFPAVLEEERLRDKKARPDQYAHIWLGDYKTVFKGAYFSTQIKQVKDDGRLGFVPLDPLMMVYAVFDIGGTGAKADACAIWIMQSVGFSLRFLHYYEAVGQELSVHVAWLRTNGYGHAHIVLPHDAKQHDKVFNTSYESALQEAGFNVTVIPNQGQGAAMQRVEVARQMFPYCFFNKETTEAGLDTLGAYHEKWDDERNIGLGPNHDYASHCADAFGLACVAKQNNVTSGLAQVNVNNFIKSGR